MPFYEFKCPHCGEVTEKQLPLGKSIRTCPHCGRKTLKKLFSRTAYHDTYSPMHPRRGRGNGGLGRVDPGEGLPG